MVNLKDFVAENKAAYIPGYATSYPDKWEYFINYVDACHKQEVQQGDDERRRFIESGRYRKGMLQIWGYFTMFAENPHLRPDLMVNIDTLKNQIEESYGEEYRSSFAIVNLSNAENITGRHQDLTHNFYVQCIGEVVWKIYKPQSNDYEEYTLKPGDGIFVPAGMQHEVVALAPRAAVTVAFHGLGEEVPE